MRADPPEPYVKAVEAMANVIRAAIASGSRPRLRMPPDEVWLVAPIAALADRLALNAAAHVLLAQFGDSGQTVMMLRVALKLLGVQYETVTLGELGIEVGSEREWRNRR